MWKDSLCIGVESIDAQHKALFDKTEKLMKEVQGKGTGYKQNCIDTVTFLKMYAVQHFSDEEKYQRQIGYKDYDAHKQLHINFVNTVLAHEKRMIASDFDDKDVKGFVGMLAAWLLYHIADSDQKLVRETQHVELSQNHNDIMYYSVCDVLNKMAGFSVDQMKPVKAHGETFEDSHAIEVGLKGDVSGYIILAYPTSFIMNLVNAIMGFTPYIIDELELSALNELSNIISGSFCNRISSNKNIYCDVTPPMYTSRSEITSDERIAVDTGQGIMETDMYVVYR